MFLYRVKYTEFESDIQSTDLLYKIDQTCQNIFEYLEQFENIKYFKLLSCIIYKVHNSYFVYFVIFSILYTRCTHALTFCLSPKQA